MEIWLKMATKINRFKSEKVSKLKDKSTGKKSGEKTLFDA
jgi:hypothetical protein